MAAHLQKLGYAARWLQCSPGKLCELPVGEGQREGKAVCCCGGAPTSAFLKALALAPHNVSPSVLQVTCVALSIAPIAAIAPSSVFSTVGLVDATPQNLTYLAILGGLATIKSSPIGSRLSRIEVRCGRESHS